MRTEDELETQGVEPEGGDSEEVAEDRQEGTSPPDPTHEATSPPSNPAVDEGALAKAKDDLDQAGGGH